MERSSVAALRQCSHFILLQKLLEAGASRGQLRAKVFGGGCLFSSMREQLHIRNSTSVAATWKWL